jgi:hypothetical protein
MRYDLAGVLFTYQASHADRTSDLYVKLTTIGPMGVVAMNLFRAQKASERAKQYSRRYKGEAYGKKQWSMDNACKALLEHGGDFVWGWGIDPKQPVHCHVLYVDLPTGQVSFHSEFRGAGPDYQGEWDGEEGASPQRIVTWCAQLLDAAGITG